MKSVKLNFNNREGIQLSAQLDMPVDRKVGVFALFAHCFTCSKDLTAVVNISRALTQKGIGVMRFDFAGLGESEGDFSDTNFSSNVNDLIDASEFLAGEYEAPQILIGHSLGGTAVLMAGFQLPDIKAIATIGSPADPQHVSHLVSDDIDQITQTGKATVSIGGRPFTVKKQFLDDLENNRITQNLPSLGKALLIMHAPQDQIVGIDNAALLFGAARHPKSFISLNGADHLLSEKQDSIYTGEMIGSWASRYIQTHIPEELVTEKQVIARTGKEYTTEIKAGDHHLLADEPESYGGNNLGPNPYELLLSSLGACKGMTLRMYANHKGWELDEVKVHLLYEKIHAEDCADCDGKEGKIDRIEVELELEGNLDEAQQNRLLEISERCPVHRTLFGQIHVSSSLKVAAV